MSGNLANKLQVWGLEDQYILFQDGSIGFGLELVPIDSSSWPTEKINRLATTLDQFLNGLPQNLQIQFIQEIGSGNDATLAKHLQLVSSNGNAVSEELAKRRSERFRDLDHEGLLPFHGLKLFCRVSFPSLKKVRRIFSTEKQFQKFTERELERRITQAARISQNLNTSLESLGVTPSLIDQQKVIELIYWQWNPRRPIGVGQYDPEDIREGLLFTDAMVTETGFSLKDLHYRVISLKILPEMTFAGMASCLRELTFDSKLFLTINVPDQQKEVAALQTQRRLAFSMARGNRSGVSDIQGESKFQDLETLLGEMIAQGQKVFKVSFNVVLRSASKDDLETQVAQTLSKVRELSGAEAFEESLASFDIFSDIAIPNARATERIKRIKTSNLSDLLPLYGPWRGHASPSILMRSRAGSLLGFDCFDSALTNFNHLISGGSGAGKSYFTTQLILQLFKESPKVFIVDVGGSYLKACNLLGGQFVPLKIDGGVSLNPFDLTEGETVPSGEKIKFLVALIELMTKEEGKERLPKLERAEIEEAIQKCYEGVSKPTLSTLRNLLLEHTDIGIRRYGRILTPWCGNTPFGRFLDRPTNLELQKSFVAFDLKGLEGSDLQAVCLFLITDFVWREIQKKNSGRKILVFDECWRLLENEAGSQLVAEVFRTFRKYEAGCIAISQDLLDFINSNVASAIVPNSSMKWILMQKGADLSKVREILQLNDNEVSLITSLHQERGVYSEAYLIAQDHRSVVVIESTPKEYWVATTDARDISFLNKMIEHRQDLNADQVLDLLAERYPTGVAHLSEKDVSQIFLPVAA